MLVGAPLRDTPGIIDEGGAYLFRREASGSWSEIQRLLHEENPLRLRGLGGFVRIDNRRLFVSRAQSALHVFYPPADPGGRWTEGTVIE